MTEHGTEPRASVVIRARNEGRHIRAALGALQRQEYGPGFELILVDTQSTDDTAAIAQGFGARVVAIAPERFSFGRALNLGAGVARGEFLVHLSADAAPLGTDYLAALLAPLADPRVAATYSRQVPGPGCGPSEARDLADWFPAAPRRLPRPFLSNASAAIRRSVWREHPFNEEVASAEDALWAAEVEAAGWQIAYAPEAAVRHSHPASPRVAYRRGRRDADGLRRVDPHWQRFGLWRMLRMAAGLSGLDAWFALRWGYGFWWWPQIPLYRLAQAWGIYRGLRRT